MIRRIIFCGMLFQLWAAPIFSAVLQSVSLQTDDDKTSIYCTFSGKVAYRAFTLNTPERAILDLSNTSLLRSLKHLALSDTLVERFRHGLVHKSGLRLVFDVEKPVNMVVKPWQPKSRGFFGLRVDLSRQKIAESVSEIKKKPALRDVLVVIDPGHGGKDPGALGARRHAEKHVVLAIARQLKNLVDKQPGMRAILTRDGDYFVALRERLAIARKHDADVFVSIHADAFVNKNSNGASVYALSSRGATSEAARWLAEKENYSELGGVDLSDLKDDSGLLRGVLIDLSQTATIRASLQMGDHVLKYIDNLTNLHHDRVEQARFVVLKSPDIPSILVETGFISNPKEERNLVSPAYQKKLTYAILKGLQLYFGELPPRGTKLEAAVNTKIHVVRRGESLSTIAAEYSISTSALKLMNHLSSSRIYVGQKIVVSESMA